MAKLSESDALSNEYMTTNEVCKLLRIVPRTLQRWRKAGKVNGVQAGRFWLYRTDEIRELLDGGK